MREQAAPSFEGVVARVEPFHDRCAQRESYFRRRDCVVLPSAGLRTRTFCTLMREFSSSRRPAPRGISSAAHTVAMSAEHVAQVADWLARRRARREASARAASSAGIVSPVPKYISSGVWPRNAECGSTRLCSST